METSLSEYDVRKDSHWPKYALQRRDNGLHQNQGQSHGQYQQSDASVLALGFDNNNYNEGTNLATAWQFNFQQPDALSLNDQNGHVSQDPGPLDLSFHPYNDQRLSSYSTNVPTFGDSNSHPQPVQQAPHDFARGQGPWSLPQTYETPQLVQQRARAFLYGPLDFPVPPVPTQVHTQPSGQLPLPTFGQPTFGHSSPTGTQFVNPFVSPPEPILQAPGPIAYTSPVAQGGSSDGSPSLLAPRPQPSMTTAGPVGPAEKQWTVPPRPKPGRKPLNNDAGDRRKVQNREAQRAIRDRRSKTLQSMQEDMDAMKASYETRISGLHLDIHRREQDSNHWQESYKKLKLDHDHHLKICQSRTSTAAGQGSSPIRMNGHDNSTVDLSAQNAPRHADFQPTPPEDQEIDFTSYYARPKNNHAVDMSDDMAMNVDDNCGFCTDSSNCACKAASVAQNLEQNTAMNLSSSSQLTGPGTCDMCRADPQKAQQCRELAESTNFSDRNAGSSKASTAGTVRNIAPLLPKPTMSCNDLIDRLTPVRGSDAYKKVVRQLHPHPAQKGEGSGVNLPAMDFDAVEAAGALASLSRQPAAGQ